MENIKLYEDFEEKDHYEIPIENYVLEEWIEILEKGDIETVINDIKGFLHGDEQYWPENEPEEEPIEPEEDMTGATADEDPTLIKKFED